MRPAKSSLGSVVSGGGGTCCFPGSVKCQREDDGDTFEKVLLAIAATY